MKMLLVLVLALFAAGCAPTANETFGSLMARAKTRGVPLLVYAYGVPGQIAVGSNKSAVPVYVQFVVTGDQPIQSVRFTLVGYSTRGTAVLSRQGLGIAVMLIGPGPFNPNENYEVNSFHSIPAGFPGGEVACIELAGMQVQFADGESRNYGAEDLDPLLLPALRRGCGDRGPPVNFMLGGG